MRKQQITAMLLGLSCALFANANQGHGELAKQYLNQLVNQTSGIGAREAGSNEEQKTAQYLYQQFTSMGYQVNEQSFQFGKGKKHSKNLIVDTNPNLNKTIVLAAHYDSTAKQAGSLGATDNGAGIAAMLTIAHALVKQPAKNYNIRFIAFGAEEVGLQGSRHYVKSLQAEQLNDIVAMINFDTIAGGDFTYVHSAHSTPYRCQQGTDKYNSNAVVRDALLAASRSVLGKDKQYIIHPEYPGYPEGVTGAWSDHAPFSCAGIPIAYVESTNFTINGKDGFDGYSQSEHPELWDCYDAKNKTTCDRSSETKWGNIWHSQYDQLETLEQLFPDRVPQQIANNVTVLIEFLTKIDTYLK